MSLYCRDGQRGEFAPVQKGDRETLCTVCKEPCWKHWSVLDPIPAPRKQER